MRKIVFLNHISLDGFVAGPKGEMDWIQIPPGLFDWGKKLTDKADAALYGRVTYGMMQGYWPTAGTKPNANKHDVEHSEWYNRVTKVVVSKTVNTEGLDKTVVIREKLAENIRKIKAQPGKNIQIYGSPSVIQELMKEDLVDEFYLCVNPVLLGKGKPLFRDFNQRKTFELAETKTLENVVILHYRKR